MLIAQTKVIITDMIKSYILIRLLPGFEPAAMSQIRTISGVLEINAVFGHWDAVAIAEAKTLQDLSKLIINQIRGIQGVQQTETLLHGNI